VDNVIDRARGGRALECARDRRFICDIAAAHIAGCLYIKPYHRCSGFIEGIGDRLANAARGARHDGATAGKKRRQPLCGEGSRRGPILERLLGRHGRLQKRLMIARSLFRDPQRQQCADGHYSGLPAVAFVLTLKRELCSSYLLDGDHRHIVGVMGAE
jgi:hypothetical protein